MISFDCCVPGCDNNFDPRVAKNSVTFHRFPRYDPLRTAWTNAICKPGFRPTLWSSVVCSKHFKQDDFVINSQTAVLQKTAVPSIFTPAQLQLMDKLKQCSAPDVTQQEDSRNEKSLEATTNGSLLVGSMSKMRNSTVADFSQLCRICARSSDRLIPVFEGDGLSAELATKMLHYLSLKVTNCDNLPKNVCLPCATALMSWHDLVLMSIEANDKLNAMTSHDKLNTSSKNNSGNNQSSTSKKATKQRKENEKSTRKDGIQQDLEQNSPDDREMDNSEEDVSELDGTLEAANKMINRGLDGKDRIEDLQEYKLHYPWKYHKVAGSYFLRTKVLGFEPAAEAFMYTCCLCCEEMKDSAVIAHSKSHYPLTSTDTCRLCHFSFSSIELLRNHIKRHLIIIDDEYVEDMPITYRESTGKKTANSSILPAKPAEKKKLTYVCEYCGLEYKRKVLYVKHVQNHHLQPFKCKTCNKRFESQTSFNNHGCPADVKVESCDSDVLTCMCNKTFNTNKEYKEHILTCDQDILCEECGLIFQTRKEYKKHNLTKHSKIPIRKDGAAWICEICGCKLGKHSARKHYLTHSFKEKKYTCEICNMKFRQKWSLTNHMQSHSDIRPYVCDICSKTFKRSDHLREHLFNKHQIGKSKPSDFKCDVCRRFFTSETYLMRHKRLHSTGMSYECHVCKGRFPTEHSLKMHQTRMKHDGGNLETVNVVSTAASDRINKFRCKFCFQRYGSMASLKKHKLKHCSKLIVKDEANAENAGIKNETEVKEENEEMEKTYECPKCNLRYLTDFGLKLHYARSKHSEVELKYKKRPKKDPNEVKNPRFKCVQCNDIFSSLVSLRMHKIKRKHFSQCPHCGKRFAMEFKLKVHLVKVHQQKDVIVEESDLLTQEEKLPYQCTVCSQLFAMRHNLEAHMVKKHSGNEEPSKPPRSTAKLKQPKTEPLDVFEEFTQEISVIYHCTECWENFASEEDFNNHTHEARIILTEDLPDNAIISEVIESS